MYRSSWSVSEQFLSKMGAVLSFTTAMQRGVIRPALRMLNHKLFAWWSRAFGRLDPHSEENWQNFSLKTLNWLLDSIKWMNNCSTQQFTLLPRHTGLYWNIYFNETIVHFLQSWQQRRKMLPSFTKSPSTAEFNLRNVLLFSCESNCEAIIALICFYTRRWRSKQLICLFGASITTENISDSIF